MNSEQAQALTRMVRAQEALENRREAELRAVAHNLIQGHLGRNRKVISVPEFYAALAHALIAARAQARVDYAGGI